MRSRTRPGDSTVRRCRGCPTPGLPSSSGSATRASGRRMRCRMTVGNGPDRSPRRNCARCAGCARPLRPGPRTCSARRRVHSKSITHPSCGVPVSMPSGSAAWSVVSEPALSADRVPNLGECEYDWAAAPPNLGECEWASAVPAPTAANRQQTVNKTCSRIQGISHLSLLVWPSDPRRRRVPVGRRASRRGDLSAEFFSVAASVTQGRSYNDRNWCCQPLIHQDRTKSLKFSHHE